MRVNIHEQIPFFDLQVRQTDVSRLDCCPVDALVIFSSNWFHSVVQTRKKYK